jgi:hypothetical protein
MAIIRVKFGHPITPKGQENISERAIEEDCTLDEALCKAFNKLASFLAKPKGSENFFDLVFLMASQKQVISPKATCSSYVESGNRMPMLVLERDYLVSLKDFCRIPLTEEMINEVGQLYQTEFDYEYVGFERILD